MEKATKILLYIILGVVLFQFIYNLIFSHSLLKDAVDDIKVVKADLKKVSDSLESSRKKIGEVMQNLDRNQSKISLMKNEVEILYLDYQKAQAKSSAEIKILKTQLEKEQDALDSLKKELGQLE